MSDQEDFPSGALSESDMCCRVLLAPQEFTKAKGASVCFLRNKSSGESARNTSFLIECLLALGKLEPLWWNLGLCF